MKTRIPAGALIACAISLLPVSLVRAVQSPTLSAVTPAPEGAVNPAECANLTTLKLPDAKVTEASAVPAASTGAVRVPHCRVAGVIGKEIRFSLLMPDEWNHKFLMGGGGGFVGTVQNQAQSVVNAGYATAGTDTGHQGSVTEAGWALNNPERQQNFGHLAVHRTAEVAKSIIRSYYRSTETRSYFSGCSNGGRQALMEAQRYPADFDGIVAGAPAYDFTAIGAQFIKDTRAAFPDSSSLANFLLFIQNTDPGSNAGVPGIQLPIALGATTKLPVGLELDGPSGSDRRLLAIGLAFEKMFGRLPAPSSR